MWTGDLSIWNALDMYTSVRNVDVDVEMFLHDSRIQQFSMVCPSVDLRGVLLPALRLLGLHGDGGGGVGVVAAGVAGLLV